MTLMDALVVTALGMGVVFIGLILTALLITSFGLLARAEARRAERAEAVGSPSPSRPGRLVDDATLAVIWTVLEVERRINRADASGRLTIVRGNDQRRSR